MTRLPPAILLLAVILLGITGVVGFVVHQQAYRSLYRRLRARGLVGDEYRPAAMSALWATGCMGYIVRLKREIGIERLDAEERRLLRRAVYASRLGVPALFLLAGIILFCYP